jgi:heme exporter protein CcmD
MGGYGAFIWAAYGVGAVVMLGLLATSLQAVRAHRRELAELEVRGRTRRRSKPSSPTTQGSQEAGNDTQAS